MDSVTIVSNRRRPLRTLATLALVAIVLAGCGPFGGDDDEPTATSEAIPLATLPVTTVEPTDADDPEGADDIGSEASPEIDPDIDVATPDADPGDIASPEATVDVDEVEPTTSPGILFPGQQATPDLDPDEVEPTIIETDLSVPATPGVDDATPVDPDPEPEISEEEPTAPAFTGSDGTGGATPVPSDLAVEPDTPGTPPPLVVQEETETVDLSAVTPVVVESCTPEEIPFLVDGELLFVTNSDVNFREGPGTDCEQIATLAENLPVDVLSAPVVREGDDLVWIHVRVNDATGWVVLEALDPED